LGVVCKPITPRGTYSRIHDRAFCTSATMASFTFSNPANCDWGGGTTWRYLQALNNVFSTTNYDGVWVLMIGCCEEAAPSHQRVAQQKCFKQPYAAEHVE
jgi:hypothetical protein